jgi:16S rRNA (guanine527-N7)-methyltransferase
MELIRSYFPELNPLQVKQLTALEPLYREWNEKINVISRKDIDHLYEHHVLHSLAMARYNPFKTGMKVLDVGTGGGFPGIPLAILFPEVQFTLLDSTAKKIHVVREVSDAIGLKNVEGVHARVEEYQGKYDMIISRAVSTISQMIEWSAHLLPSQRWVIFKGGDPADMRKELPPYFGMTFIQVSQYFKEDYFIDKYIVDVQKKI